MQEARLTTKNSDWAARASQVFGGGALANYAIPPEATVVLERGQGSHVFDVDGRELIDCHLGSGPLLLGHCHPEVVAAVQRQAAIGSTFHLLHHGIIELAEQVVEAVPCADTIRFVSTGTEATFYALRLARAFTGRSKVMKFEGALHGGNDYASQSTAPSRLSPYPHGIPDSDGIPAEVGANVLISEFNNLERTAQIIEEHGAELAAVIVEPMQRALKPEPGFLAGLRELTRRAGTVLIFDEVVTGFRLAWGGAQEHYGVVPDLATLGKAFAGGYPVAAVCGRRDVMDVAGPGRRGKASYALISGTFNGNPIGAAAALAALQVLRQPGVYPRLHAIGDHFRDGMNGLGKELGMPVLAIGDGPVAQVLFGEGPVRSYREWLATDGKRRFQFGVEMVKRGVLVNPGEKFYFSIAHTDADLERILEAGRGALLAMRG
ncbi:MAG: aminotransferase class III-fold pyridoxal phosphate-dependent enzyme [Bacteroidetes bacterium]|nr:aminotransferase class III-fold pyridoxal phosphate-dependent enzyme [Bacteroidota bacterium]